MRRRGAIVLSLTVFGGAAVSAATIASAAPSYPRPCPTQPVVWQSDGKYYVSVPDPTGEKCRDVVEIPGNIQRPGAAQRQVGANGCPTEPILYESDGHDYLSIPDPSGKACRMVIELPVTVPPSARLG